MSINKKLDKLIDVFFKQCAIKQQKGHTGNRCKNIDETTNDILLF